MNVFIAKILDTAITKKLGESQVTAICDHLRTSIEFEEKEVIKLRWTKRSTVTRKPSFLIVVKYWITPFGVRKLRIQCHKIHESGRIGSRRIIEERHSGEIVRS